MSLVNPIDVFSKNNNIYYRFPGNRMVQATTSKKDLNPVFAPNKKIIAFIRESSKIIPKNCADFANLTHNHPTQIWIYNIKTKKEYLLINNNFFCDSPKRKIIDPHNLQFSPDSKKLYFMTSAWVTSEALHYIELNKNKQHFLMPALDYKVLQDGKQEGYLLVQQHRYHNQGGSFNGYEIFTSQGKKVILSTKERLIKKFQQPTDF